MQRPTWAEINLNNLAMNYRALRRFVGENVKVMAVVKADAYGHGALSCAKMLVQEGADWFGVALPEEAFELRESGIEQPILSLGGFWHGQEKFCLQNRITPIIYRLDMAESLDRAAREVNLIADVHVKIDTGMGRLGIRFEAIPEFAEALRQFKNLRVDGLMTHFAAADDLKSNDFTDQQTTKFTSAVDIFQAKGFRPTWRDLANSPATLAHKNTWGNLVRIGGALYGIGKDIFPKSETVENLLPVMSIRSKITLLKNVPKGETLGYSRTFQTNRDSLIATVPIGYNDGMPRALSNKGKAIVNGYFVPIVGRVSMDLTILDVTDLPHVEMFDEVIFAGSKGSKQITVEEMAAQSDTISYEITCGIGKRVPRRFS
ncbi:MAG: alanine racemase [Pyrinomonadaceae bacterium]